MDYLKAEKLRKEWGDKPCSHPNFEVETHLDSEYVAVKTGDYVLLCVGKILLKMKLIRSWRPVMPQNKQLCFKLH